MLRTGVTAAVLAFCLAVAAADAAAQEMQPFVVKDIRVEGLQRTEPGTVFSYLPVKVGETMNAEKARAALRALYATGFFADVRLEVENDVLVVFVRERPAIAQIDFSGMNIVGAEAFREKELLGLFVLRTPSWLTWYTQHDRYSRERLAADLETLRSFYLNRGYLDFSLESTQVSITPDRRDIYITVNIVEGQTYTVSNVTLGGQMLLPREELEKLIQLKPGDVFSREKLAASTKAISDRLGNEGYAFANANAIPNLDKEKRTVAFSIVIDPGRRVYVRRIDVAGNNKTRDEVIRREMRQLEGAYYDASKIQLSRRRIDRTQFFGEVTVETLPVEGSPDQVDVVYTVKEKPTGALLLGIGFSSVEKIALSASITQSNAFGSGKFLSANVNSGSVNQVYSLSYMDPYYTVDGVSRGFDIYKRETDASSLAVGPYVSDSVGGGVKFGYPVSEQVTVDFGVNLESVELEIFSNSPLAYIN